MSRHPASSATPRTPTAEHFYSAEATGRLGQASVLVVGAGGLGCPALIYLAAAGVGKITLLDDDAIEDSNLARQILFAASDLGKSKALVAGQKLTKQFPACRVVAKNHRLSEETKEEAKALFAEADLVLDASDNRPTRLLMNDIACAQGTPLITGALGGTLGLLATLTAPPCYRCLFPQNQNEHEPPPQPVLGALAGIIGAMMANEAVKLLLFGTAPSHSLAGKVLLFDCVTGHPQILTARPQKDCPTCS